MSEHSNSSRSGGIRGRGLLVGLALIVVIGAFVAVVGSDGADPSGDNPVSPAIQAPAPVPTQ